MVSILVSGGRNALLPPSYSAAAVSSETKQSDYLRCAVQGSDLDWETFVEQWARRPPDWSHVSSLMEAWWYFKHLPASCKSEQMKRGETSLKCNESEQMNSYCRFQCNLELILYNLFRMKTNCAGNGQATQGVDQFHR